MNIAQYENSNIMGRLKDLNKWIDEDRLYVRTIGEETDTYYIPDEYLVFEAILQDGKILLGIGTGELGEECYIDFESDEYEIFIKK
jgi:hypothetical protein